MDPVGTTKEVSDAKLLMFTHLASIRDDIFAQRNLTQTPYSFFFLIGLVVFLEWSCVSSLYIFEIRPLSEVSLANMKPHIPNASTTTFFPLCD